MLIFGDPADEGTGFGVGWEASEDDGQQQLPAGAEEGGLAGQMRSTIKQRAMRLDDLKLARKNACYDEHGHATEEAPHRPADEVIAAVQAHGQEQPKLERQRLMFRIRGRLRRRVLRYSKPCLVYSSPCSRLFKAGVMFTLLGRREGRFDAKTGRFPRRPLRDFRDGPCVIG